MPTRLLLNGSDIETLLARVQEEHGSAARIVHAERVRSRGVAGFFAKERYEVSVEVDDPPTSSAYDAAVAAPSASTTPARPAPTPETPAPYVPVAFAPAAQPATSAATPLPAEEIPAALLVAEELDGAAPREMSTGSTAFAEVLDSITTSLGTGIGPGASDTFVPAQRPAVLSAAQALATVRPARPATLVTTPTTGVSIPPAVRPIPLGRHTTRNDYQLDPWLMGPPPSPPRAPGAVLALVGEGRTAYEAACHLARIIRIDRAEVLLASPEPLFANLDPARQLSNGPAARARGGALQTAAHPSVVVVDYPLGADPAWSRDIIDALGATAVWALVDATRKVADLHRWSCGIQSIDALVVHNAAISQDALSVTALGPPVAMLDGMVATEAVWQMVQPDRVLA